MLHFPFDGFDGENRYAEAGFNHVLGRFEDVTGELILDEANPANSSVRATIHGMLVLAGILSGFGGALTALAIGHIDPTMAYWTMSGSFVFATVLAGTGSVLAPFLGALLFEIIRVVALQFLPEYWQLILGTALLLIILYLPGGIWSLFERKHVEAARE